MNWLRQLFSRNRLYRDLSDEIRQHIEERAEELMQDGMSEEAAITVARREFGNPLLIEERGRQVWTWVWVEAILRDLRFALRQLRRNPGFTLTVILTLALAVGANTAVFSAMNAILLRPLPYPQPERLGALVIHHAGTSEVGKAVDEEDNSIDGETWELVRDNVTAGQAAVWANPKGVNLQASSDVRYVQEQRVSSGYFEVLGTPLLMGRTFSKAEDKPHSPAAVVLSYELWSTLFSSNREILGRVVRLKGEPYPVVGVLAPRVPTAEPVDLWTPLQPSRLDEGAGTNFGAIFRLHKGTTWNEARAQLSRLQPAVLDGFREGAPQMNAWLDCIPLQKDLTQGARVPILALMFAVSCILLIASANLAGLMLVRIGRRSNELATRLALGATRGALIRQVMMEPLILGLCGGGLGFGIAVRGLEVTRKLLAYDQLPAGGLSVDGRVFAFAAAVSIGAILMIGMLPALDLRTLETRSSTSVTGSRLMKHIGRHHTRQALIAGEIVLTVVLLSGAGVLVRTLVYLETLPPGFDATDVMTAKASLNDLRYQQADLFHKLLKNSVSAMKQIPGVESAAVGLSLPYERGLNNAVIALDGDHHGSMWGTRAIYVTPEYFRVLRIPLLSGRAFLENDSAESERVAIINSVFVRSYFGSENPVGRHLQNNNQTYTIVGVVGGVTNVALDAPLGYPATFYVPATQMQQGMVSMANVWFQPSWIVRTRGPIQGLTAAMQRALAQVDPTLPFAGFHTLDEMEAGLLRHQRVQALLLGMLAGLALLLSLVGLYGLVSNLVVQRTREIGIRMALGSSVTQAMKEMSRPGIAAAVFGLGAGLMGAAITMRLIRSQLYGVRAYDPVTLGAVCLLLMVAALVASFLPTLRIASIDPATTLRSE
jgi:predicted permease